MNILGRKVATAVTGLLTSFYSDYPGWDLVAKKSLKSLLFGTHVNSFAVGGANVCISL